MKRFTIHLLILLSVIQVTELYAQTTIYSFDSFLVYVEQRSTTIRSGQFKLDQANAARLAAVLGVIDLTGSVSLNITNNTELPVSVFPAETFGGTPGTFREVQTGIQYTNNFNQYAEVRLINPSGWKNLKLSKINIEKTETNNWLNKKSLYENLASTYFNILGLQSQYEYARASAASSDTIFQITKNKFQAGLVRKQELSDAEVNFLNTKESANQIYYQLQQQYLALKILADIPEQDSFYIGETLSYEIPVATPEVDKNRLSAQAAHLNEQSALTTFKQNKYLLWPTLSAFVSNSYQQFNTQFSLFDDNVNWINSNFIGLKLNWTIPSATTISQISKSKYDYWLTLENARHTLNEANLADNQLKVDYVKATSQARSDQDIVKLRSESYQQNFFNYKEGLVPLDQLLNSYVNTVNSQYNLALSMANVMLTKAKININNSLQ